MASSALSGRRTDSKLCCSVAKPALQVGAYSSGWFATANQDEHSDHYYKRYRIVLVGYFQNPLVFVPVIITLMRTPSPCQLTMTLSLELSL